MMHHTVDKMRCAFDRNRRGASPAEKIIYLLLMAIKNILLSLHTLVNDNAIHKYVVFQ